MPTPLPPKIPSAAVIQKGTKELAKLYEEIDKQIGAEANSKDQAVSDAEVATFLSQRGDVSPSAGAAVASLQAYLRHVAGGSDVPLDDVKKVLGKVPGYIEKAREKSDALEDMKPTWRAIAVFAQEIKSLGLKAKEIVADRAARPIGDLAALEASTDQLGELLAEIGARFGGGKLSTDAVAAYIANGPNTVATAKDMVRRFTMFLEHRTGKTTFTKTEVKKALGVARVAFEKNADGPDDRSQLARTWQSIAAFSDENAIRGRSVDQMVGDAPPAADGATAAPGATTPDPASPADPNRATTLAAFKAIDDDTKAGILDSYGDMADHYTTTGRVLLEDLTGPAREFADKMHKELLSLTGDFEEHSGVYGTIGDPVARVSVVTLPDGTIAGGNIWLYQQGFHYEDAVYQNPDREDDIEMHYDTAAALDAEDLGVDSDDDINWQVSGVFEATAAGGATPVGGYEHVSDYWEWGGY